jgi:hypothetical protein
VVELSPLPSPYRNAGPTHRQRAASSPADFILRHSRTVAVRSHSPDDELLKRCLIRSGRSAATPLFAGVSLLCQVESAWSPMSPAGPESEPDDWREPYARATAHRQRPRVYPKKRRLPAMRCWRNRSARPYRASSRARLGRSICGELRPSFDVASQQRHSYASCADAALRTSRPRQ